jgi:MFS family permease
METTAGSQGPEQSGVIPASGEVIRVAIASGIGTTIEFYDFILYNVAAALVFNKLFFVSTDPLMGTLVAYVTFFLGFCARPLGGLFFGHFGDRVGRRTMLLITVLIMGVATVLIGLMPTYAKIGLWRRSDC